jgi:hypothetical protein
LHAAPDAEIRSGHDIEPANAENQEHVDGPRADAGNRGERFNDLVVGKRG